MWGWFLGGYLLFTAALAAYAAHVALSKTDEKHRADAYRVLKLVWGGTTVMAATLSSVIRLHEVGIL